VAVPTLTCPHCNKPLEAGPEHCPSCHLRLPGPPRLPTQPARARRPASAHSPARAPASRAARAPAAAPAAQCPACAHPISRDDEWCKWCHWPVNRKER